MSQTKQGSSFFGARELKVVLIGDASVGKTSILNRYITGSHSHNISPTLGAAFTTKLVESNGENVKLQIWDTSGEERYRSMAPLYYRGASVVLLVFDLTLEESFKNVGSWLEQLKSHVNLKQTLLILIGNKLDRVADGIDRVPENDARSYAESINAKYFESSAVTGENVESIFDAVAAFNQQNVNGKPKTSKNLAPADDNSGKKKSCC